MRSENHQSPNDSLTNDKRKSLTFKALYIFSSTIVAVFFFVLLIQNLMFVNRSPALAAELLSDTPGHAGLSPNIMEDEVEVPERCLTPPQVSKQVTPTNVQTGGIVTISVTINELNNKPADVILVLDVSESMKRNIGDVISIATAFVQQKKPEDRIGIVTFSDITTTFPLTENKEAIIDHIQSITSTVNKTEIGEGLLASYTELISSTSYLSNTMKGIILFSDARHSSLSVKTNNEVVTQTINAYDCGIPINTVEFNTVITDLMSTVATSTRGIHFYAPITKTHLDQIYAHVIQEFQDDLIIKDELPPGIEVVCRDLSMDWKCNHSENLLTHTIEHDETITNPQTFQYVASVNFDGLDAENNVLELPSLFNSMGSCLDYNNPHHPNDSQCIPFFTQEICVYSQDKYEEGDDSWHDRVPSLQVITGNVRNFESANDVDWVQFPVDLGYIYTISTKPNDTMGNRILKFYLSAEDARNDLPHITITNTLVWGIQQRVYFPLIFNDSSTTLSTVESVNMQTTGILFPKFVYLQVRSEMSEFGCGTQYLLTLKQSPSS